MFGNAIAGRRQRLAPSISEAECLATAILAAICHVLFEPTRLPQGMRALLNAVAQLLLCGFSLFMLWRGAATLGETIERRRQRSVLGGKGFGPTDDAAGAADDDTRPISICCYYYYP